MICLSECWIEAEQCGNASSNARAMDTEELGSTGYAQYRISVAKKIEVEQKYPKKKMVNFFFCFLSHNFNPTLFMKRE